MGSNDDAFNKMEASLAQLEYGHQHHLYSFPTVINVGILIFKSILSQLSKLTASAMPLELKSLATYFKAIGKWIN
jgi:hypothetical protein